MELEFKECEGCSKKPGHPTLCKGCLHNRALIQRQTEDIEDLQDRLVEAFESQDTLEDEGASRQRVESPLVPNETEMAINHESAAIRTNKQ